MSICLYVSITEMKATFLLVFCQDAYLSEYVGGTVPTFCGTPLLWMCGKRTSNKQLHGQRSDFDLEQAVCLTSTRCSSVDTVFLIQTFLVLALWSQDFPKSSILGQNS